MLRRGIDEVVSDSNGTFYIGRVDRVTQRSAFGFCDHAMAHAPLGGLVVGAFAVLLGDKCNSHVEYSSTASIHADWVVLARIQSFEHCVEAGSVLSTRVEYALLGMLSRHPSSGTLCFSRDIGDMRRTSSCWAFLPSPPLLETIVNGTLDQGFKISIGSLRQAESASLSDEHPTCVCYLNLYDIRGKRSAVFGKTRLGKSNLVKVVMQGMLEMSAKGIHVGQLVFDVNGEYANDNPQDGSTSIATLYSERVDRYFLAHRQQDARIANNRKLIRYNFFERTHDALPIMQALLERGGGSNDYLRYFFELEFPSFLQLMQDEQPATCSYSGLRRMRKIQLLWTILHYAGFPYSEDRLVKCADGVWSKRTLFDPKFSPELRSAAYQAMEGATVPRPPASMSEMAKEIELICRFARTYSNDPGLIEGGAPIYDNDDMQAIRLLVPDTGVGSRLLSPCLPYHSPTASDFVGDIIAALETGRTVIIDLGSATERALKYFSDVLSVAVFRHQESKFVTDSLGDMFVQLYFEEAHMIFPPNRPSEVTDIYSRFAKEGAKFQIGIVYSTQSPSTVNAELLAQTENFFIGHLSSQDEVNVLCRVQHAFESVGDFIMGARQTGYLYVMSNSHRYPIPVQIRLFNGRYGRDRLLKQIDTPAHDALSVVETRDRLN